MVINPYMTNKLIYLDIESIEGKPSFMRLLAFREYFNKLGYQIEKINKPNGIKALFSTFIYLKRHKNNYFFISMPPFGVFWLFLVPGLKIILDIRDGWSIAQETGYGGIDRVKPFKAKLTRIIERYMIHRAYLTIVCTNGLQDYFQKISNKEVLLIPNGVLDEEYSFAQHLKSQFNSEKHPEELIFCCAGQFSEYGVDKVKKLFYTVIERYKGKNIKFQLIGSDRQKNDWFIQFCSQAFNCNVTVEILPHMAREELYRVMIKANYGLVILRDPSYEFGTKVYDYLALGLPVINYFDTPNKFTNYFDACLDKHFSDEAKQPEICRSKLISTVLDQEFKNVEP